MNNSIKRVLFFDLQRVILSWQFYLGIGIIIFAAIITYSRNYTLRNLCYLDSVGTLNTFIYSNIVSNNIIILLAPVIAALGYSTTIIEDMKTGVYKQIALRTTPMIYIKSKVISSIVWGGGIFLISYIIIFIGISILDPATSVRTVYNRDSLFGLIYDHSMFLYCIAFIGYAFIFGSIYSLISLGIAMITNNKYMAITLPFFVYYISEYVIMILPVNMSNIISYFLPTSTFDILTLTPVYSIFQLTFALFIAIGLITYGSKSLLVNDNL